MPAHSGWMSVSLRPADAPAIIFIHGWPHIGLEWRHQMSFFAKQEYHAIAPDLRGCGRSAKYPQHAAYAQRQVVMDMMELADGLGIGRAIWVGHDWGAIVVSNVARHHPERCLGVVGISQPFNTLEMGAEALIPLVNRTTYPAARFPAGQFEYILNT